MRTISNFLIVTLKKKSKIGKINFNNIFILSAISKIVFQDVINIKISNENVHDTYQPVLVIPQVLNSHIWP